jgi:hypothetical protein
LVETSYKLFIGNGFHISSCDWVCIDILFIMYYILYNIASKFYIYNNLCKNNLDKKQLR